jgi:plastocyanin
MSIFSKVASISLFLLTATSAFAGDHKVTVGGGANVFSPRSLTIDAGDTVTFVSSGGFHNVVADNNAFTSGAPADTFSFTQAFPTAGTFPYYCSVHGGPGGAGMSGTIKVNAVTAPPAPPISGATSGSWYDPDQSGHGFSIQVAPPNIFLVYWFTFAPDGGQQAWLLGSGNYDPTSNTVTVEAAQSTGTRFPPNFNHADITTVDWGSITFTFTDCSHGTVSWNSKIAGYGTGSMPLTKIIGVNGLTCTN